MQGSTPKTWGLFLLFFFFLVTEMHLNLQMVDSCFLKRYLFLPEHPHLSQLQVPSPSKHPYGNAAYCNVLWLEYLRLALEREQIMPAKSFSSDTTASALGHLPAQLFFWQEKGKKPLL